MNDAKGEPTTRKAAIMVAVAAGLAILGASLVWFAPWANALLLGATVCAALGIRGSRGAIRTVAVVTIIVAVLLLVVSIGASALFFGVVDG